MTRTFYECPKCPCRFLTEKDLMAHTWQHLKPNKRRIKPPRLTRRQTLRKYRTKLWAYHKNYGETGLCFTEPWKRIYQRGEAP